MAKLSTDAEINSVRIKEAAAPSTPASGYFQIYAKTDGKLYTKNDAGTEVCITDLGGASTPATCGTRVKRASGNVAINTTYAAVGFDAEDYDTDTFHDTVTNNSRITIPSGKDGKYHISA